MPDDGSRPSTEIDRSSPVPFYHQLKLIVREMITLGDLGPGDLIPGELRLCKTYDVSRTVVRQALVELEFEGVIDRQKGRGTFVSTPKEAQGLVQSFTGQFEDLAARGVHLRSEVLRLETIPADPTVARHLSVETDAPVVILERLRFIHDEPRVLALTYLARQLLPALLQADLKDGSLYAVMDTLNLRPSHGKRTIEAREAGKTAAHKLGLRRTAPVMLLTSLGLTPDGRPVEYFEAFHRGDRSRFEVDLVRNATAISPPLLVLTDASTTPTLVIDGSARVI